MKIFISWSGETSKNIALILRDWLPSVIQTVIPYVSTEDLEKGSRWASDISKELDESQFGIICLTKENLAEPWINFEAGALGKKVEQSKIYPLLFGLNPSDVNGPLLQFQQTIGNNKEDFLKLIKSISKNSGLKFSDDAVNKIFETWWPQLEEKIKAIPVESAKKHNEKEDRKMVILEELLNINRINHKLLINREYKFEETQRNRLGYRDNESAIEMMMFRDKAEGLLKRSSATIMNIRNLLEAINNSEDNEIHLRRVIDMLEGLDIKLSSLKKLW